HRLEEGASLAEMLRAVRAAIAEAESAGLPWQAVIDSLRPVTPALWRSLSAAERRRFLVHLRPYWDVHRHRTPIEVWRAIEAREARGGLEVTGARLVTADLGRAEIAVT